MSTQVPNNVLEELVTVMREIRDRLPQKIKLESSKWQYHSSSTQAYMRQTISYTKIGQEINEASCKIQSPAEDGAAAKQEPSIAPEGTSEADNEGEY